jgi:hypothetical protein
MEQSPASTEQDLETQASSAWNLMSVTSCWTVEPRLR